NLKYYRISIRGQIYELECNPTPRDMPWWNVDIKFSKTATPFYKILVAKNT
ncbi:hypothetical protein CHS0354_009853, partial [Potamilus streckersoni]